MFLFSTTSTAILRSRFSAFFAILALFAYLWLPMVTYASGGDWTSDFVFSCSPDNAGQGVWTLGTGHGNLSHDIYQGVVGASTILNGHFSTSNPFTSPGYDCASIDFGQPWFAVVYPVGDTTAFRSYFETGGSAPNENYGIFLAGQSDTTTHVIDFFPHDTDVITSEGTSSPVFFSIHAYINPGDLGSIIGVRLTLHNIDQNTLLQFTSLSGLSPNDIYIFEGQATTTGDFYYSATSTIANGNYRVNAVLERTYLFGFVSNPFSSINEDLSHQFIVGTSTFIGNLSQNGYDELQTFFATSTATSTAALSANCNPISGIFDIRLCAAFLFIPGGPQLDNTIHSFKTGIAQRAPWGYVNRFVEILSNTATTSLPSFTAHIPVGGDDPTGNAETIHFDMGDFMTQGALAINSVTDPYNGMSARDIFEPLIRLAIALSVLFTIAADVMGSHRHHSDHAPARGKT